MVQATVAFFLFLSVIPFTTIIKAKGVDLNVLPAQAILILGFFMALFSFSDRKVSKHTVLSLLLLAIIFFVHSLLSDIAVPDLILNTLTVFLLLLTLFSFQWPPRKWLTINIDQLLYSFFVIFSASTAFLTPIGTTTNAMVFSAGGYSFGDYSSLEARFYSTSAACSLLSLIIIILPK